MFESLVFISKYLCQHLVILLTGESGHLSLEVSIRLLVAGGRGGRVVELCHQLGVSSLLHEHRPGND